MKKLLTYIKDFARQDYTSAVYTATFLLLCVGIVLNYTFHLENKWIKGQDSLAVQFLLYLLLYSIAYYGTLLIYYGIKKTNYFSDKVVMSISFLALLLISFDRAFTLSPANLQQIIALAEPEATYLSKIINIICPTLFYITVIFQLHKKYSKSSTSLYGLTVKRFDLSPYFYMLLCMIPLLLLASFREDFTHQYPFFKYWKYDPAFGLSRIQLFSVYEFFYLGNFINIELLFRGLLVIGMVRMMGKDAILPMVVTYAFLHFGKPFPETISSIFGGYIVGIFAHKTENIMGGIFIHMAIALLMDVFALWQLQ